jgi:methionyl aminopeptidase
MSLFANAEKGNDTLDTLGKSLLENADETEEKNAGPDRDEEDDDDDDEDEGAVDGAGGADGGAKKKKKKKKPKKKKKAGPSGSKAPLSRLLTGFTDYYVKYGQTDPPTKLVSELFPSCIFPEGEIVPHGQTKIPPLEGGYFQRVTEEERR